MQVTSITTFCDSGTTKFNTQLVIYLSHYRFNNDTLKLRVPITPSFGPTENYFLKTINDHEGHSFYYHVKLPFF